MASLLSPIRDVHSERRLFLTRVVLASVVSLLLLGLVVARLVQLQIVDHELFAEKSQGNRVRIVPAPPIRGLVLDRKGRVIAENLPAYQLEMIPEQVGDVDDTLNRLAMLYGGYRLVIGCYPGPRPATNESREEPNTEEDAT